MAKVKSAATQKLTQKLKKEKADKFKISLTPVNYGVIGLGIIIIVVGYIFMSQSSVDGFFPTVLAPILLVLGYCVVIPVGILLKTGVKQEVNLSKEKVVPDEKIQEPTIKSANIKTN
jgi:hypothetical protein